MPLLGGAGGGEPPFSFEEDAGANQVLIDMSVSATPGAGTEESYHLQIDGESFIELYAEADGAGGLQNKEIKISEDVRIDANLYLKGALYAGAGGANFYMKDASGDNVFRIPNASAKMMLITQLDIGTVQSAQPTPEEDYFCLYIDTDDDHLYCVWDDGGVTKTLDVGQLT